jgi:hypothetical protein
MQTAGIIIVTIERIQRALLFVAFLVAAILLLRFTIDFFIEMPLLLALPFSILVAASLFIAAMNLMAMVKGKSAVAISTTSKALLLASIPSGFVASTLDCSGFALQGCTPFCSFIKLGWIPLLTVACALYFFKPMNSLLLAVSALSFITLAPHCVCFNVGNGWWIQQIGASPMCYVWGFVVTLISISALKSGVRTGLSLLVNGAIIGGALTFFISHHYFHFPW